MVIVCRISWRRDIVGQGVQLHDGFNNQGTRVVVMRLGEKGPMRNCRKLGGCGDRLGIYHKEDGEPKITGIWAGQWRE